MSVEAIVRVVEEEAAAESDQIIRNARAHATELVAGAEAMAAARVREACDRAEPAYRAEATRQVNAARVRLLEWRAARTAALIDAVIGAATERLAGVVTAPDGARWHDAIVRLVQETAAIVGPGGILRIRPCDAARTRAVAERLGCTLQPFEMDGSRGKGDADALEAGVVGWSADLRIEVDGRLRVRLERARIDLSEPVARLLGVEA